MEFILLNELKELSIWQWVLIGICILAVVTIAITVPTLPKRRGRGVGRKTIATSKPRPMPLNTMIFGAMCVAIAFVLSYIKLVQMPMGGSITLCSMLPLFIFSYLYGARAGLLAGLSYGLLQFIQKPEIYHWAQVILEYPLAFSLLGLAGVFIKKNQATLIGGICIGTVARACCHIVSGAVFFAEYMPQGWSNAWVYSLAYNGSYMAVEMVLCIVLSIPIFILLKKTRRIA